MNAQDLIDECEQETYAEPMVNILIDDIRKAEFLGNAREKYRN
jgi:hypothetical protein